VKWRDGDGTLVLGGAVAWFAVVCAGVLEEHTPPERYVVVATLFVAYVLVWSSWRRGLRDGRGDDEDRDGPGGGPTASGGVV